MSLSRTFIHVPRHKWAIWQMERSGLNKLFKSRDEKALVPQAFDLWFLYRQIRKQKPRTVVEFGVGNSTIMIAEAISRNGHGELHTIDASQHWLDDTYRCLPDRLKPLVRIHHSDLAMMQIDGTPCHRYVTHPDVESVDMLFLDGPNPGDVPNWVHGTKRPIAADPVLLEDRASKHFRMIVDSRNDNVAFLKNHLKRRYRAKTDKIFGITTFDLL